MVTVIGNGHSNSSSNPVSISHRTNTLRKDMNPTILPPTIRKIEEQTGFFSFDMATNLGEGKL